MTHAFENKENESLALEMASKTVDMSGPQPKDNHWIIEKRVLIGRLPRNDKQFKFIVNECNIHIIICLTIIDHTFQFKQWIDDDPILNKENNNNVKLIHFPIKDFKAIDTENNKHITLIENMIDYLLFQKKNIFIHCKDGHGYVYL